VVVHESGVDVERREFILCRVVLFCDRLSYLVVSKCKELEVTRPMPSQTHGFKI
jgi:hypothetical protein